MSEPGPVTPGAGPAGAAGGPPGLLNVANMLTVTRMLLVPACIALLAAGGTGYRYAAFAAFAVASVTDLLDGELARRRNLITDFGKIADPIADKALTGSALVTLSALGELAWWVTVVIVARELAVTVLRFWVIRRGVIAASRGGKIKTLLQVLAISLYILPWHIPALREALMAAAVVVTLATGLDYTARAIRLHRAVPGLTPAGHAQASHPQAGHAPAGHAQAGHPQDGHPQAGRAAPDHAPPGAPHRQATGSSAVSDSASGEATAAERAPATEGPGAPGSAGGPDRAGRGRS